MSDRQQSTLTPPPPEPSEAFRETFLIRCEHSRHQETLRRFGDLLPNLVQEAHLVTCAEPGEPDDGDSTTARELRAVLSDLRFLTEQIEEVGRQYEASSLDRADILLSMLAEDLTGELTRIAERIAKALDGGGG